ncbi:RNA-directed DNA polymerase from mobile element jockey [Trichonephila clavipes]|nr:RNA-directed DNA polymerase from mobile element jockey [Trichonephila clavipes]
MQNFLDKLQDWLTQWRIAINVDKSQAIIFRKWGVIDPPFQLTLFEDNIQWVSVVRYLGLHMDSRLTYKKHIDYLSDKFWGRIHLAISLVGRNSPLSLENKVVLYKQVLRPIITYASPVWGAAAATHMKKIQVIQNKILRLITNAPWYVRNDVIHYDLHMEPISRYITNLARNVFRSIENHDNPIIRAQTMFTYPHPKLKYAYATAKWQLPLKPPYKRLRRWHLKILISVPFRSPPKPTGCCHQKVAFQLDTLREDCGIIRKQASTDGKVLWKIMCVDVVQVRRKDRSLRDPREARSRVRI